MKIALVAFQGEVMCFAHVLLNAADMHEKGHDVKVVIEGAATKLIPELADPANPFAKLFEKVKNMGVIDAVCKACAAKMESLDAAEKLGLPLNGEMSGHPPLIQYVADGYQVINF